MAAHRVNALLLWYSALARKPGLTTVWTYACHASLPVTYVIAARDEAHAPGSAGTFNVRLCRLPGL